nr:hypothetical protein [Mucilaginibacter sp. X5P1]
MECLNVINSCLNSINVDPAGAVTFVVWKPALENGSS